MAVGTLVGGLVGGAIGFVASGFNPIGFSIGYAIGGAAGFLFDKATADPIKGPKLEDLSVSSSAYGASIPRIWGRVRLPGNMIWSTGLIEYEETTGDKMKEGRFTTYKYKASFAMAFCAGPCDAVVRIWADGTLVYDNSAAYADVQDIDAPAAQNISTTIGVPGLKFRFYKGDEEQLPDPAIIAKEGASNAPAHRGLCYIVFEDAPLEKFGNRIPVVSAEIVSDGEKSSVAQLYDTQPGVNRASLFATDWSRGRTYWLGYHSGGWGISVTDDATQINVLWRTASDIGIPTSAPNGMFIGDGTFLYVTVNIGGDSSRIYILDPDSLGILGYYGDSAGSGQWINDVNIYLYLSGETIALKTYDLLGAPIEFAIYTVGGLRTRLRVIQTTNPQFASWYYGGSQTVSGGTVPFAPSFYYGGGLLAQSGIQAVAGKRTIGRADVWVLNWDASDTDLYGEKAIYIYRMVIGGGTPTWEVAGKITSPDVYGPATDFRMKCGGVVYDNSDDSLILFVTGNGPASYLVKWDPSLGIVWQRESATPTNGLKPKSRVLNYTYGWLATGEGTWTIIDTRTGQNYAVGAALPSSISQEQIWDSLSNSIIAVPFTGTGEPNGYRYYLDRVAPLSVPLASVVSDLCQSVSLTEQDFDVTQLSGTVTGFVAGQESRRQALESLAAAYQFDGPESNWRITFRPRGGTAVANIGYGEIVQEDPDQPAAPFRRTQELELPRRAGVRFRNIDRDQQTDVAFWTRRIDPVPVVNSVGESVLDLSMLVMTPSRAKTIAKRTALAIWAEREQFDGFRLPPQRLALEPGDPINLTLNDGATVRLRLTKVDIGADFSVTCEAVEEEAISYTQVAQADGGTGFIRPTVPTAYATKLLWADTPLLSDADDLGGAALRYYTGGGGYSGQTWRGAVLYTQTTGEWQRSATLANSMAWGTALAALPAPSSPFETDRSNTLRVAMQAGAGRLSTITEAAMLAGGNKALLISQSGAVEVIQFATVTPEANGTYTLSTLLRGRRGSDHACASHGAGDLFVLADDTLQLGASALSLLATRFYGKPVGVNDVFDLAPVSSRIIGGAAERPYSPVHVAGARDGSDNLTVTWVRRTRLGGQWLNGTPFVAIGETTEAYEVDVMNGSTVVRTITGLTAPTCTYTAAQQTTDFGSPQAAVTVRVYQMSAAVGRGYPREATV